jgi:hypothetical protein
MKKSNCSTLRTYTAPQCFTQNIEIENILTMSPGDTIDSNIDIKDPIWNTGGDYGLE